MSESTKLPPLPKPSELADFSERQMQAYARAAVALNAPKWQPIETAPKDGTVILLGRHMENFGFIKGYGYFAGEPDTFVSGWISTGFDPVMSNLGLAAPTHWMPLPAGSEAA